MLFTAYHSWVVRVTILMEHVNAQSRRHLKWDPEMKYNGHYTGTSWGGSWPWTRCEILISLREGFRGGGLSLQIPGGLSDLDLWQNGLRLWNSEWGVKIRNWFKSSFVILIFSKSIISDFFMSHIYIRNNISVYIFLIRSKILFRILIGDKNRHWLIWWDSGLATPHFPRKVRESVKRMGGRGQMTLKCHNGSIFEWFFL